MSSEVVIPAVAGVLGSLVGTTGALWAARLAAQQQQRQTEAQRVASRADREREARRDAFTTLLSAAVEVDHSWSVIGDLLLWDKPNRESVVTAFDGVFESWKRYATARLAALLYVDKAAADQINGHHKLLKDLDRKGTQAVTDCLNHNPLSLDDFSKKREQMADSYTRLVAGLAAAIPLNSSPASAGDSSPTGRA